MAMLSAPRRRVMHCYPYLPFSLCRHRSVSPPLSFAVQLSVTVANASTRTKVSRVLVIMTFHWPLILNPRHLSLVE